MVKYEIHDNQNHLLFTEGYIPDFQSVCAAYPRSPPFDQPRDFQSRDAATAWLLSALARRLAYHSEWRHLYGGKGDALNIPLETWLLGPPHRQSARLGSWFEGESAETDYRLMVHRVPSKWNGELIPSPWRWAYHLMRTKSRERSAFHISHKRGKLAFLKPNTCAFLAEVLNSYQQGVEQVQSLFAQSGHHFWYSNGLPSDGIKS